MLDLNSINARGNFQNRLIEGGGHEGPSYWNSLVPDPTDRPRRNLAPNRPRLLSMQVHQEEKRQNQLCIPASQPQIPAEMLSSLKIEMIPVWEKVVKKEAWKKTSTIAIELLNDPCFTPK